MVFGGPRQHSVALPQCLFKAEEQALCCDASGELEKLSHLGQEVPETRPQPESQPKCW